MDATNFTLLDTLSDIMPFVIRYHPRLVEFHTVKFVVLRTPIRALFARKKGGQPPAARPPGYLSNKGKHVGTFRRSCLRLACTTANGDM